MCSDRQANGQGVLVKLTSAQFEPHVRSDVIVYLHDGTPVSMMLTRVSASKVMRSQDSGEDRPGKEAFEMTLEGPHSPVIRAMTYSVVFPATDPLHFFVSPHHQDDEKTLYNIVVN